MPRLGEGLGRLACYVIVCPVRRVLAPLGSSPARNPVLEGLFVQVPPGPARNHHLDQRTE